VTKGDAVIEHAHLQLKRRFGFRVFQRNDSAFVTVRRLRMNSAPRIGLVCSLRADATRRDTFRNIDSVQQDGERRSLDDRLALELTSYLSRSSSSSLNSTDLMGRPFGAVQILPTLLDSGNSHD
jgi:hypothetical protein